MKNIIIAIDGYSSCGKSTLARDLAAALGFAYVDSGAMYRAVTLYFLDNYVPLGDPEAVDEALSRIRIEFKRNGGANHTFLNGEDVEEAIRDMRVSAAVSPVAAVPAVRRALVQQQQAMGKSGGIVMDGRDIGTVVFPDADLKVFLTAEENERVRRRRLEMKEKGLDLAESEVRNNLAERDHIDSTREDSPLRRAQDAVVMDNTHLSRKEQLEQALDLARAQMPEVL